MSKIRKWISRFFCVIGFITVLLLIWSGAFFAFETVTCGTGHEEYQRWTSPDGKVDAVLMQYNGGATTSIWESVYIVPAGKKVTKINKWRKKRVLVFAADHMRGRKISWLRDKVLEIQYEQAMIHSFKNYAYPLKGDYNYEVEVREVPLASQEGF